MSLMFFLNFPTLQTRVAYRRVASKLSNVCITPCLKYHRAQTWLHEGIIVKVLARQLPDYYQKKGQVLRVHDDGLIADIKMQSTSDVLRVDSSQLETVIPKPGNGVLILRGRHAGKHACLTSVDTASMKARVSVDSANGEEAEYGLDDISKLV